MKFTVARSELLETLSVVSKGMSARSTLPILSGILITTHGEEITLQSTDLEVSVRRSSPALIEKEGKVVLPGKLLMDIVRNLPEAAVTIETEGEVALVRCQHSSFTVRTLNSADFPKFPAVPVEKSIILPSSILSLMVRQVSRAVSRDETRAVLTGILFVVEGSTVRMVATDSYRLAVSEMSLVQPAGDIQVVVPGKALEEVTRMVTSSEDIKIGVSENQIVFDFSNTTFITRVVEGNFINYRQLIPKESNTAIVVSSEEIISAVRRVSLMALHNTPIKFTINSEDQTLSLSSASQDIGDASEDIMVKIEGNDIDIAFNHTFLIDGLNSAGTQNLRIELQSPLKPGIIKTVGDEGFLYLLMPVRLN
ncbi:MAG: DNA polymerase III subunit beta [Coriobacteriia bacterium]|nr:DNA polymerase III subunit beta [Coriobacteriia bacterium]